MKFFKRVLALMLIIFAVQTTMAQERPKNDLPIAKQPLTMEQQKRLLSGNDAVAQEYYYAKIADVKSAIIASLNAYSQKNKWEFEDDNSPIVFDQEDLVKYFEKYFIEQKVAFNEGDYDIYYCDRETGVVKHFPYRKNKDGEVFICINPNKIPGIKGAGSLAVEPLISEVCGNMISPPALPKIESDGNVNEDGPTVDVKKGDKSVLISDTGVDVKTYHYKDGSVSVTIINKINQIQQGGDLTNTNTVNPTNTNAEELKPYQHIFEEKTETVYVDRNVPNGNHPLEDGEVVYHKNRVAVFAIGVGLVYLAGKALLAANQYRNYSRPCGDYYTIPPRTFNTIQGNTWATTSGGLIEGNAGGGNLTNYRNTQGFSNW